MTDTRKDGGPAFPTVANNVVYSHGMLLRDYFAGQALAGALSNPTVKSITNEEIAFWVFKQADAMLAAREKGGDE